MTRRIMRRKRRKYRYGAIAYARSLIQRSRTVPTIEYGTIMSFMYNLAYHSADIDMLYDDADFDLCMRYKSISDERLILPDTRSYNSYSETSLVTLGGIYKEGR